MIVLPGFATLVIVYFENCSNFIHQLLLREEEERRRVRKLARQAAANGDYNKDLESAADEAYELWNEAHKALYDFEDKEW